MNTGNYIAPNIIMSVVAAMIGDRDFKILPYSFYISLIQKAFEELALDTFFDEKRIDVDFPYDNLTLALPEDCFQTKNIYIYSGTQCDYHHSRKVWWKKDYFTQGVGNGYIASNKGNANTRDPFYSPYAGGPYFDNRVANGSTHINDLLGANKQLFYNIQMGNIMFSSSCRAAGNKVHIQYSGTGCPIGDLPIIPIYLRTAIEDYVMVYALMFRVANDSDPRRWQALLQTYERRLDRNGFSGSWHNAELRVKNLNASQRTDLYEYLGRPSWGSYI